MTVCTHTHIGHINKGVDGRDHYFVVRRTDGRRLTVSQAVAYLLPWVYREGNGPGTPFCHVVHGGPSPVSSAEVICVVENRYDN